MKEYFHNEIIFNFWKIICSFSFLNWLCLINSTSIIILKRIKNAVQILSFRKGSKLE